MEVYYCEHETAGRRSRFRGPQDKISKSLHLERATTMTWFETEELAKYVFGVENALDDWGYDNSRMRLELAELDRVEMKLRSALRNNGDDKLFHVLADEVLLRTHNCRREIEERLMA